MQDWSGNWGETGEAGDVSVAVWSMSMLEKVESGELVVDTTYITAGVSD